MHPEVVVVSPLTRALETTAGVFGSRDWEPGSSCQAFMLPLQRSEVRGPRHRLLFTLRMRLLRGRG